TIHVNIRRSFPVLLGRLPGAGVAAAPRRHIQATTGRRREGDAAVRGTGRTSRPPDGLPSLAIVVGMKDVRGEVREFLTTRRAKVTPEQAGLPRYGGRRRVTGLRRDEVAQLAGISIEYYTRLERGNIRGISDEVLDGIARALHLDEVERAHL